MEAEKRTEPLKVGEKIYSLVYLFTHWEYAPNTIVRIEDDDPLKPSKFFLASHQYCAVKKEYIFRKEETAAIAVSQLNEAITRSEGKEGAK